MASRLLRNLIAGRDVDSMSTTEAKELVAQFFLKWSLLTFGQRNQQKLDYLAMEALKKYGLEYFA